MKSAVTSILASPNRLHYGFEVEVELSSAHHITVIIRCQHHDAGGNTLTTTTTRLFHKLSSDIDHPFKHVPDTQRSESWDEDPVGDSPTITQKKTKENKETGGWGKVSLRVGHLIKMRMDGRAERLAMILPCYKR